MGIINNADVLFRGQKGEDFRLNESGLLWVTPDYDYAADPHYGGQEGGRVYPVHIDDSCLFDYQNKDHKEMLLTQGRSPLFRSAINGGFRALADTEVVNAIKKLGFGGFRAIEPEGQPSVALFDLSLVKKAFGPSKDIDRQLFKSNKIKLFKKYEPELFVSVTNEKLRLVLKGQGLTILGYISAERTGDTYSVSAVAAKKGFGKFMYAFASMALYSNGLSLTPSRTGNTSPSAQNVWDSFKKKGYCNSLKLEPGELYRSVAKSATNGCESLFRSGERLFEVKSYAADEHELTCRL
ncbi:hypothetical protein [Vibrio owensii]|uniref:hypothetical protein n=1 Tax=Vibrio owensii TaxID=696485 RepID=UPI003CC64F31